MKRFLLLHVKSKELIVSHSEDVANELLEKTFCLVPAFANVTGIERFENKHKEELGEYIKNFHTYREGVKGDAC